MKKKAIAAFCAAGILCASLSGCTGYSGHKALDSAGENLALSASAVLLAQNGKTKNAARAIDGNPNSNLFVSAFTGTVEIDLGGEKTFNTVVLREAGWNIRNYHIDALVSSQGKEEKWDTVYEGERIEALRYCALQAPVTTSKLRIVVDSSSQPFALAEIEVYNETPAVNRSDFLVTAYLRTDTLLGGSMYDPQSTNYTPLEYYNSVGELNFLGNVTLQEDGTLSLTKPGNEPETSVPMDQTELAEKIAELRAYLGDRRVLITMTVGTPDGAATAKAMTEYRDTTLTNTMELLQTCGFDGVSYDWERPQNQEQFDAFSDYLIALRPLLDEQQKRLTLAWAPWGVHMKEEAVKTADAIELMTYDLFDQYGNQASFMESTVQAIEYFLDLGYDRRQLHIGLPYYGRPNDGAEEWPSYDDERYQLGWYNDVDKDFLAEGLSYFNSCQSVMDKTAYAINQQLGGVMIFRLELDRPYEDKACLTKAIEQTLDMRTVKGGVPS